MAPLSCRKLGKLTRISPAQPSAEASWGNAPDCVRPSALLVPKKGIALRLAGHRFGVPPKLRIFRSPGDRLDCALAAVTDPGPGSAQSLPAPPLIAISRTRCADLRPPHRPPRRRFSVGSPSPPYPRRGGGAAPMSGPFG